MSAILAVDDEPSITELICRVLTRDGHVVQQVNNSMRLLTMDLSRYDLILCDIMMPGMDGLELVDKIRPRVDAPILFLTAKSAESDAVEALQVGADDYIRKPFGNAELCARVNAHLRRERRDRVVALTFGDIRLMIASRELSVNDIVVPLTPTEYAICEFLARNHGQVFSRERIRDIVGGFETCTSPQAISMHVSNARTKLREAGADPLTTVWGMGYKWQVAQS